MVKLGELLMLHRVTFDVAGGGGLDLQQRLVLTAPLGRMDGPGGGARCRVRRGQVVHLDHSNVTMVYDT